MIVGTGIDLVEIGKLRAAMERRGDRLRNRIFTPGEIRYCDGRPNPFQHYAARFAAKEALFKAIGTGWSGGVGWRDAEVRNQPNGKPDLLLSGKALEVARQLGAVRYRISLSHTDRYAVAQVILED
ncbi:MAG: holo-[acyl-carrier-protein] synthase [Acidobacteria bacterium]|nr:holo-[acyl-carrier-protein] synthase [Acidobacteriota bacterium]MYC82000.1 holo-[acyl-carrier-protein] synthase [Acidobacteriota bacterium]